MRNELRASSQVAPKEMKASLEAAAEKAEKIFHGGGPLTSRMKEMLEMLRDLSNEWIRNGYVR